MTIEEYFKGDPVGGADFLELARQGAAETIVCGADALALYVPASGAVLVSARSEAGARRAVEKMPRTGLYCAHGEGCARLVREAAGCRESEACHQARYTKPEPPAPVPGVELRPLDERHADIVAAHYGGVPDPSYAQSRLAAGVVLGAYVDGALAGFIGTHAEGSMGMLEIFPEYRRRGLGFALEAGLIRRILERGGIPYCHVVDGNEASMRLQRKLGLAFSEEPVYWLS